MGDAGQSTSQTVTSKLTLTKEFEKGEKCPSLLVALLQTKSRVSFSVHSRMSAMASRTLSRAWNVWFVSIFMLFLSLEIRRVLSSGTGHLVPLDEYFPKSTQDSTGEGPNGFMLKNLFDYDPVTGRRIV